MSPENLTSVVDQDVVLAGPDSWRIPEGEEFLTGMPKQPIPEELIGRLTVLLASLEAVEEAFIGQMQVPSRATPPNLFLQVRLVEISNEWAREFVSKVRHTVQGLIPKGQPLDIMPMAHGEAPCPGILRFYKKGAFPDDTEKFITT